MNVSDKRIVFSNTTPNDQGFFVPNNVIDFSRYNYQPVILRQHNWHEEPLGMMTDIKLLNGNWTGIPKFHRMNAASILYDDLWQGGWLTACSIGGDNEFKRNAANQPVVNKEGYKESAYFGLYEVSMVTLPSNPTAVAMLEALKPVIYDKSNLQNIETNIITLSSKFMETPATVPAAEPVTTTLATPAPAPVAAPPAAVPAVTPTTLATPAPAAVTTGDNDLPPVIKSAIDAGDNDRAGLFSKVVNIFSWLAGGKIDSVIPGAQPTPPPIPQGSVAAPKSTMPSTTTPVTLPDVPATLSKKDQKVKEAKDKAEVATNEAEEACTKMSAAKTAAEAPNAPAELQTAFEAARLVAETAVANAETLTAAYQSALAAPEETPVTLAAPAPVVAIQPVNNLNKPIMKTPDQMRNELNLAAKPSHSAKVGALSNGVTFSKLAAEFAKGESSSDGAKLLSRVMSKDAGDKDIADYAILLNSIINDGKFAAIREKTRIMQNVQPSQLNALQGNPNMRSGLNLDALAARLNRGEINGLFRDGHMRQITSLTATDDFLASPDLLAVEFLPLAIFKLFPTTDWKNDIPMFGATDTGNNTGVIWANIAADPAIYKGTDPSPAADYSYTDTAVALKLVPYWLQPMIWKPLTMHQLRYDMMSTGWAQAFAKWGAVMDNDLIYTLASTVPAGSIVQSSGGSFTITGSTDPNSFIYNPAFTGSLAKPTFNDITRVEQIYKKQNFQLKDEKTTMILDSTADSLISQSEEAKSLLLRWVNAGGAEVNKWKNTLMPERSQVAIYDPATGQVKDPNGAIPATSTSANLGFIPSQVGMGLGMLDVFMIQDPSNYGYKMSADIRIGITPLRANFNGTSLLVYGNPQV